MKPISALVLAASLFAASWMSTAVAVLCRLGAPAPDIRVADLNAGRLEPMLFGPTLWAAYPSAPASWAALAHSGALACVGAAASVIWLRTRSERNGAAPWVLAFGCVPYAIGRGVLAFAPAAPAIAGAWIAFMLLGVFYAACLAVLLVLAGGFPANRWDRLGGDPHCGGLRP